MKYIVRMDYGRGTGWWVRIRFFHSDIHISKFFSDSVHGGKQKALQVAIQFRGRTIQSLKKQRIFPKRIRKTHHKMPNKGNSSGIAGVALEIRKRGRRYYRYWRGCYYLKPYQQTQKNFAVNVHGEKGAFLLAKKFREDGLRKVRQRMDFLKGCYEKTYRIQAKKT